MNNNYQFGKGPDFSKESSCTTMYRTHTNLDSRGVETGSEHLKLVFEDVHGNLISYIVTPSLDDFIERLRESQKRFNTL